MKRFCLTILLLPLFAYATELKPWLSPDFEFQFRSDVLFQSYKSLAAPYRSISHHAHDQFYHVGLELTALDFSGELETTFANTHRQHGACDNWRLTGRYRLMNDRVGDAVSLTAGLTLTQAFKHSVFDVSSFHHGQFEAELHVAVGKECTVGSTWSSRWWGICGLGMADRGYPWLRPEFCWEKNVCDRHLFGVLATGLVGFGPRSLHRNRPFRGYGSISHHSIDLGVRYVLLYDLNVMFEYRHRVYARNFPKQANLFLVGLWYSFSPVDFPPTRWLLQHIPVQ